MTNILDDELDRIFAPRDRDDMGPTIAALLPLYEQNPHNARLLYEVGGAYDTAGEESTAVIGTSRLYEETPSTWQPQPRNIRSLPDSRSAVGSAV